MSRVLIILLPVEQLKKLVEQLKKLVEQLKKLSEYTNA